MFSLPLARVALLMSMLAMSGCAAHYSEAAVRDPYGFFSGIWHGILFPFAVLINIFSWLLSLIGISILDSVQIVGRPNTGLFYYLGFALGLFTYGGAK